MKKILYVGDSISAQFERLKKYDQVVNLGVGGFKTTDIIPLMKQIRLEQPDVIFLMIGINDFLCNKRTWEHGYTIPFHKTYDVILDMIRINLPRTKLYVLSILPINVFGQISEATSAAYNQEIDVINRFILEKSKSYQATFLDISQGFKVNQVLNPLWTKDGIHLNDLGYEHYEAVISKYFDGDTL